MSCAAESQLIEKKGRTVGRHRQPGNRSKKWIKNGSRRFRSPLCYSLLCEQVGDSQTFCLSGQETLTPNTVLQVPMMIRVWHSQVHPGGHFAAAGDTLATNVEANSATVASDTTSFLAFVIMTSSCGAVHNA
jgi:hypothetical protein